MSIATKIESRADYIKQLTQSLSNPHATSGPLPPVPTVISGNQEIVDDVGDDLASISGNTTSSVLYKYGKEASLVDQERSVRSSGSGTLSKAKPRRRRQSAGSLESIDGGLSELKSMDSVTRESATITYAEDPHMQFMLNKEMNKGKAQQKLVSGSQFRNTTKLNLGRCEQCCLFDRVNKKHKETIRSMRLQIVRLEEQNHDLKRMKSSDAMHHMVGMKPSTLAATTAIAADHDDEDTLEDIEFLVNKCENYEADIAKMKKMLIYERGLNEGLRKTLDETRTSLRDELSASQTEVGRLSEDWRKEKARREVLQASNDESTSTLLRYKSELEKAENKLNDCLLQLSAQKTAIPSVDHLKEIERLRGLLAASESSAKNLTAQLAGKEHELSRTSEKLAHVEAQVQGLEERRAAAETQLQRAQGELKAATDLVNSTKKHAAMLQDTLNVAIKEKDGLQRSLASSQTSLEHSQTQSAELRSQITLLNERISELMKRMARDSENTTKALEKAITASVRLCVVAPTVNVHVSDKKLKFKSGLSKEALKSFLSDEVLEKYSFLFKQKHENSAPDGSNLEPWLQALLGQMQTSIEQHVNSAMDGSAM